MESEAQLVSDLGQRPLDSVLSEAIDWKLFIMNSRRNVSRQAVQRNCRRVFRASLFL